MSVNIFGGARDDASTSHGSVGNVGIDRNFNQRIIMLSNKLAQKVNKSGDTMEGDLKLKFKLESTCVSLTLGVDGMDRNRSMSLLLCNVHNQIHHANNALVTIIAQHGFKFKCSADRTTSFDHDIKLSDKHITGVLDPVLPSGVVTKHYSDGKLALAVNELINFFYLNTASLSNLQTDMISRIETGSSAAASVSSNQNERIQEMFGKIELNPSGLVGLRQDTTEHLQISVSNLQTDLMARIDSERTAAASAHSNYDAKIMEMLGKIELNIYAIASLRRDTTELIIATKTDIEADLEQEMSTIRGRQQEVLDNSTANQRSLNLSRTRHSDLKIVVDANKLITDDLVARVNSTRFVKSNVGIVPRLTSNTNKEFTVIASNDANDAWKVFNLNTTYYWNPGVSVLEGRYVAQVYIQIKLPTAMRIHKFGLKARSDSEQIESWSLQGKNADGVAHTLYNPNVHLDRVEDRYIGATVKYFDILLSLALNYLYHSVLIDRVDSQASNLTYFQIYSLDEVIEMPVSSDGSYINT